MCWRDDLSNEEWWKNFRQEQRFREILKDGSEKTTSPTPRKSTPEEKSPRQKFKVSNGRFSKV